MKKLMFLSVLICALFVFFAAYAEEPQGIKIGQATLHPSVTTEGRYDDNVFLDSGNGKHDIINITSPKLSLSMPFGEQDKHLAELVYRSDIETYSKYKMENFIGQDVNGSVKFSFPNGYLKIGDWYRYTHDRSDTEFTQLIKRNENTGDVVIGVVNNKLTYELGYQNFDRRFVDSDFQNLDYMEHTGRFTGFYQLFPKTQALFEYKYSRIIYTDTPDTESNRDGIYNQYMVGLKGDLTGKTVGIVKVGYQDRTYKTEAVKDFKKPVAEMGVITKFSDRTETELKYSRLAYESTYLNNNYYDANRFQAKLTQKLIGNFSLIALFQYEHNKYPEEVVAVGKKRVDNIYTGNIGILYDIKDWLKAKVGYEYRDDSSNIPDSKYKRNLTSISFTLLM